KRLGLVTSAWHMKRALRLARVNGLSLQPLPADFRGTAIEWAPRDFNPTGSGFLKSELACKEILAGLVGR
ncbi:MAG: YdcF family protein, partial [Thermoguttaceae bacterium]